MPLGQAGTAFWWHTTSPSAKVPYGGIALDPFDCKTLVLPACNSAIQQQAKVQHTNFIHYMAAYGSRPYNDAITQPLLHTVLTMRAQPPAMGVRWRGPHCYQCRQAGNKTCAAAVPGPRSLCLKPTQEKIRKENEDNGRKKWLKDKTLGTHEDFFSTSLQFCCSWYYLSSPRSCITILSSAKAMSSCPDCTHQRDVKWGPAVDPHAFLTAHATPGDEKATPSQ